MIRSLTVKLTLAFLLVGLVGTGMAALVVAVRTRVEFNTFVSDQEHTLLAEAASAYYAENGSWDGLENSLQGSWYLNDHSGRMTVVDARQQVVYSSEKDMIGRRYPGNPASRGLPIRAGSQVIGYVLLTNDIDRDEPKDRDEYPGAADLSPEELFLSRMGDATLLAGGIAVGIALLLGLLLARTLSRPIKALTRATQAVAEGALGQQVVVQSSDEIGELAASFNRMSTALLNANQSRRQMTADIAHDLRTPLTILRGYTEGLKDDSLKATPEIYNTMYEEVRHLEHLVDDLRTLSLADAGELTLNQHPVDPKALLERTGLAYVVEAEKKGLQLRVEAASDLPAVAVDPERFAQVLNNLVSNALTYTQSGEVVLSAFKINSEVVLTVSDTGTGIPEEDLPFIFNRFYRVDKARQRPEDGSTGLGLAIAKAIVLAHNGRITATSQVAAGTTFSIYLPAL